MNTTYAQFSVWTPYPGTPVYMEYKDKINVEYFIVKRRVPVDAEYASMQRRVQQFSPNAGPRKTKQLLESMNKFMNDVLDQDGKFIEKEYKCNSPLGKCDNCMEFPNF